MFRIIALAPNAWREQWMNRQQLLSRLGRRHRVLFSNGALHSWMRHDPAWPQYPWRSSVSCVDQVYVDEPGRLTRRVQRIPPLDATVMSVTVRRWRRVLGDPSLPLVLHIFHPMFASYRKRVKADFVIYHAYDLYSAIPDWTEGLAAAEAELARESDLVIGSSKPIVDYLASLGARDPLYLPNGVDYQRFSLPSSEPPEYAGIPHPRIGYVGSINRKVDLALLNVVAQSREEWQIVIVGEIGRLDAADTSHLNTLLQRRNVHYLGAMKHTDLPKYLAPLDVGLLAYKARGNVWTKGIYPLKLHEYLAAGLPIVSSDIPSVHEFSSVVTIVGETAEDWIAAIDHARLTRHAADAIATRRRIAADNSWDKRVELLEDTLKRRFVSSVGDPHN